MPFKDVAAKLNNISLLAGKNDKRDLLKAYLTDSTFADVIKLMFEEGKTFNINELPPPAAEKPAGDTEQIFKALESLAKKNGATEANKQKLSDLCGTGAARDVVLLILNKKSDAGFSLKSVVTVAPWLMSSTPYQRCSGEDKLKNIVYPAYAQKKADGMFSYSGQGIREEFGSPLLTRKGKRFDVLNKLDKAIDALCVTIERLDPAMVKPTLAGELVVLGSDGKVLDRKTGNGIINKFVKGTGTEAEAKQVRLQVWDAIPLADFFSQISSLEYQERYATLKAAIETLGEQTLISLIDCEVVNSEAEARKFYAKMRAQGEEGAIVKNFAALWRSNTSTDMIKLKHFVQAEFEIVAAVEGKGKYAGKLGALTIKSRDGGILCNVGSGFTDGERSDLEFWEKAVGKIVTLQFESVVQDKNGSVKCLFLPTFIETRFEEKTEADTTEYVEAL